MSLDLVPCGTVWNLGCAEKCLLKRTPKGECVLLEEIQLDVWVFTKHGMTDFQLGLDASVTLAEL